MQNNFKISPNTRKLFQLAALSIALTLLIYYVWSIQISYAEQQETALKVYPDNYNFDLTQSELIKLFLKSENKVYFYSSKSGMIIERPADTGYSSSRNSGATFDKFIDKIYFNSSKSGRLRKIPREKKAPHKNRSQLKNNE